MKKSNSNVWKKLEEEFALYPMMVGEPVSKLEIADCALNLGVSLDPFYAEFLHRYGGAMVGSYPILGLRHAEVMGDNFWSVEKVTQHFIEDQWPGIDGWYIISHDGAGNPIGIALDGKVKISDHDVGAVSVIADSFEDFLLNVCLTGI